MRTIEELKKELIKQLTPPKLYLDEIVIVEKVMEFAEKQHQGQVRKFNNEPFFCHPLRVAISLAERYTSSTALGSICAALLHDTVEDTEMTYNQLYDEVFSICYTQSNEDMYSHERAKHIVKLVAELTNVYTKDDFKFLNRRERNDLENKRLYTISGIARLIKLIDIDDNTNFGDFKTMSESERNFAAMYVPEKLNLVNEFNSRIKIKTTAQADVLARLTRKLEEMNMQLSKYRFDELKIIYKENL